MKYVIATIFIAGTIAVLVFGGLFTSSHGHSADDFLRLHIRANSNSAECQTVKYAVKQSVINEFTPIFANITSRESAMHTLNTNIPRITQIANRVLLDNGKDYTARVSLRTEFFPTRSYHGHTLPAGNYDALIIELGNATGDNWWCVVYPPLCFLDNNIGGERGVVYRSRLNEIITRFF